MLQPKELTFELPMTVANGAVTTTSKVWDILSASRDGDLEKVKSLVEKCPELIYAQYNYTPPIHFAVREGHAELVKYLLSEGAHDPTYRTYPFLDNLVTIAKDRGHSGIADLLQQYYKDPSAVKFKGDNGEIHYNRTALQQEFQRVVNNGNIERVREILNEHPEFALDETYFWGEGILLFAVKEYHREMIELLMDHGAKVPDVVKWAPAYYVERYDSAEFMLKKGMNPNIMSWHHVTILHNMAQVGDIKKAALLIQHGADINSIEEEYQSTPLGLAARWGHTEMVKYLLSQGADPLKSGAQWSTPVAWARKKGHTEIEKILTDVGATNVMI